MNDAGQLDPEVIELVKALARAHAAADIARLRQRADSEGSKPETRAA
jgi:hypothetical protein